MSSSEDLPYQEAPEGGTPELISTESALDQCIQSLARGNGPVAFDSERAHGHRYFPKAYLFQIRRAGLGTALIDPIAFERSGRTDLSALVDATAQAEWIIHSASQDLPCMVEDHIVPAKLFDTELAARLLNYPKVGLATLIEVHFDIRLRKAHSADDWSTRPLPNSWLAYAALDVEYLIPLRQILIDELGKAEKLDWANQEFSHLLKVAGDPPTPDPERWRRTKGLREVRSRRGLAIVRALWEERDAIAKRLDRPSGRILADSGIITLAAQIRETDHLPTIETLRGVKEFSHRTSKRFTGNWLRAINQVDQLVAAAYPPKQPPRVDVGQPKSWIQSNPSAANRWHITRPAVDALAETLNVPPALLLQPAILRDVVFHCPDDIENALAGLGARPWQITAVTPALQQSFAEAT